MAKHWIGMNGSIGCLPDNCFATKTKRDAIESMAQLFDLSASYISKQIGPGGGIMYLDSAKYGADYIEISPCNCPNMDEHNDP